MAGPNPTSRQVYDQIIARNLARKIERGPDRNLGGYVLPLVIFLIVPALVFWLMSNWFNVIVPFPPALHAPPAGADAAALNDALCGSGAFTEQRLLWAAGAWLSLVATLALTFYAAYSMRLYFPGPWSFAGVLAGVAVFTTGLGCYWKAGGRLYEQVFPGYFVAALKKAKCVGSDGKEQAFGLLEYFDPFFDVINFASIAMCLMVAASLIFTITNVSAKSDTEFLRRQHQRFRKLLYLGSLVLVIGVWQLKVWATWPVEVIADVRQKAERSDTALKLRIEWIDAKLGDGEKEKEKKIEGDKEKAVPILEPEKIDKAKLVIERRAARDQQRTAQEAKAELERRKEAAEKISRGFTDFLGILYTLLLILLFAPAWTMLDRATRLRAIEETQPPKTGTPDAWLSANGLDFKFTDQLKPLLAIVGPLLAASLSGALSAVIGK